MNQLLVSFLLWVAILYMYPFFSKQEPVYFNLDAFHFYTYHTITFSLHYFFFLFKDFFLLRIAIYDYNQTKHKAVNMPTKYKHRGTKQINLRRSSHQTNEFIHRQSTTPNNIQVVNNSKAVHTGSQRLK